MGGGIFFLLLQKENAWQKKKETREPFEWFSGLSIDQGLPLDGRRMEVGEIAMEFVWADVRIELYCIQEMFPAW